MPFSSKIYSLSDEEFRALIARSICYSDVLREIGLDPSGGSSRDVLKRRIQELGCSTEHFDRTANRKKVTSSFPKKTLSEILVENSSYTSIDRLKKRLVKEGILEYKCAHCGINTWNGKPLSLQLHHKNGKNNDHRIENLEFLCPNCHSQTDNYSGKNSKKEQIY